MTTFTLKIESGVVVIEASGDIDVERARELLELAHLAAADHSVAIDLNSISSLTVDAAALLLFRTDAASSPTTTITLRTNGRPAREAVLQAYARRRARPVQA